MTLSEISPWKKLEKIYFKPNIPLKKSQNAIKSYAHNVKHDEIEILLDDTVFGSAKNGILITNSLIYCKEDFEDFKIISLEEISFCEVKNGIMSKALYIDNQKIIELTQNSLEDLQKLASVINKFVQMKDTNFSNHSSSYYDDSYENFIEKNNENLLKIYQKNDLLKLFEMKDSFFVKSAEFFISDSSNELEVIQKLISDFYMANFKYIYENYIKNQSKPQLKNDFVYFEIINLLTAILDLCFEKLDFDKDEKEFLISQGLIRLGHAKNLANLVFSTYFDYKMDSENIFIVFALRIFCNHFLGVIVNGNFNEVLLQGDIYNFIQRRTFDKLDEKGNMTSIADEMANIAVEILEEFGDLVEDEIIFNNAFVLANKIANF